MIREANIRDIPQLLDMCEAYTNESSMSGLEYSEAQMVNSLMTGILSDEHDISVLEDKGKLIGWSFSNITNPIFTQDKVVECTVLYVIPEYRIGRNGIKLIKNLSKVAKKHKAKMVHLGVTSEIHTDKTTKLYSHLGYREIGKDFRLEV